MSLDKLASSPGQAAAATQADANDPFHSFQKRRVFSSLDGLRGISIVGVIWFHVWILSARYRELLQVPILRNGAFGVDIFFALSGFLITTLLLREQERFGSISLSKFYMRRTLRIWPLYYTVLAFYICLVSLTEHGSARAAFFRFLPGYLTFTYTWLLPLDIARTPHFHFGWSLASEEQFYLFWPLTLVLLGRRRAPAVLIALIGLRAIAETGLLRFLIPFNSFPDRVMATIPAPICLGALLGCALQQEGSFRGLYRILGKRWSAPVILLLLAVSLIPAAGMWHWFQWSILPFLVGACVVREDNGLAPVLKLRLLSLAGVISYGMYLLNLAVIGSVGKALGRAGIVHPLFAFPLMLGLTYLAAWISYTYYEARFLRLKERWAR